jgi:hypothetical protein
MGNFYLDLFLILLCIFHTKCFYCGGKLPTVANDCTDLSTTSYQCCYMEGNSVLSAYLTLKFCYGFPAGTEPSKMISPNTTPKININVVECGTPAPNSIQISDMCGVTSPNNATICNTFGSNCCYLYLNGNSFCLNKNSPNVLANRFDVICKAELIKLNFVSIFFILLIFIFI